MVCLNRFFVKLMEGKSLVDFVPEDLVEEVVVLCKFH